MPSRRGATPTLAKWGEFLRPAFADVIRDAGIEIRDVEDVDDLVELGAGCDALFVRMPNYASEAVLQSLPCLKVVAVPGAGLEIVDVEAATALGVPVVDGRGIGADAVVEWTLGSMIWLARDVGSMQAAVREGRWEQRHDVEGRRDLGSMSVGVVGYGAIGSRVARRASQAFGSRILVTDVAEDARARALQDGFVVLALEDLLTESELVTIHTQVEQGSPPLFDAAALRAMRFGSFLVNTTRGNVLDYESTLNELASGRLSGAAIDVYPEEPPSPALVERLLAHDRVLLSPHQGGMTLDATERLARTVANSVVDVLQGRAVENCANPEVFDAVG